MKPLEQIDLMTEETDSKSVRDAVKQLSFAYKRSAKTRESLLASEAGPEVEAEAEAGDNATDFGEVSVGSPDMVDENTEPYSELMVEALRRTEAVLFAAGQPMSAAQIAEILPPDVEPAAILMELRRTYAGRGINLVEVAGKWRFQTAQDMAFLFVEERHVQKKLSQAALETLSIIAYGQPVTRAEIEAVRGVAVAKSTMDGLLETSWIKITGRRQTPGQPETFGTTDKFLEHFGLEDLSVLPGKSELEADGLLSDVIPEGFEADEMPGMDETDLDMGMEASTATEFVADFIGEDEAE